MKKILIIGGTSNLGACFTNEFSEAGYEVHATGRKNIEGKNIHSHILELGGNSAILAIDFNNILDKIGFVDLVLYCAGGWSPKTFVEMSVAEIVSLQNVLNLSGQIIIHEVLKKQNSLGTFVAITSHAQFNPSFKDQVYGSAKAGFGYFAKSISMSGYVTNTVVIAPPAMYHFGEKRIPNIGVQNPEDIAKISFDLISNTPENKKYSQHIISSDLKVITEVSG